MLLLLVKLLKDLTHLDQLRHRFAFAFAQLRNVGRETNGLGLVDDLDVAARPRWPLQREEEKESSST